MSEIVLKNQKLWFGGYDLSCQMNALGLDYGAEMQDNTTFCDDTRSNFGGLKTVAMQCEGFFDGDPYDEALFSSIGESDMPISFGSSGDEGDPAYTFKSILGEYSPGGTVGEILAFSVGGSATGNLVRGTLMVNDTKIVTGDGTARQLGAVAAGKRVYASLHVISASETDTLDVVVTSDDNAGMTSATTRLTFDQQSAIGSDWQELEGPVTDDYWQVSWAIGGVDPSFQFVVIVGII